MLSPAAAAAPGGVLAVVWAVLEGVLPLLVVLHERLEVVQRHPPVVIHVVTLEDGVNLQTKYVYEAFLGFLRGE